VAHDLRAPLRSIDGFSQALLEDCGAALGPDGERHVARVRSAAQRMGRLIDDLLKLSHVSRSDLQRARVNLSTIAAKVVRRLREAAPERNADVVIEPDLFVIGDARLLEVVLTNFLDNAWKFTSRTAGARIEVGARRDPSANVFYVRDNGAGFDPAYGQKLFGTFQRLHGEHEFPGTGIGLATAQRILRRHGGRAWAESALGVGATFYFTVDDEAA
jgi:signal transduction histidine kinase